MRWFILLSCMVSTVNLFGLNPQDALSKLKEGNIRFVNGQLLSPRRQPEIRATQIAKQNPFCAVLACADSRVAPEILFDQGIGDLFVVRLAGNVASESAIESLAYASDVLAVSLIVVMGHQNCGAVDAVMHGLAAEDLGKITDLIEPAVEGRQNLQEAILSNVRSQAKRLLSDSILQKRLNQKSLRVVGAYYDFESGRVNFFDL